MEIFLLRAESAILLQAYRSLSQGRTPGQSMPRLLAALSAAEQAALLHLPRFAEVKTLEGFRSAAAGIPFASLDGKGSLDEQESALAQTLAVSTLDIIRQLRIIDHGHVQSSLLADLDNANALVLLKAVIRGDYSRARVALLPTRTPLAARIEAALLALEREVAVAGASGASTPRSPSDSLAARCDTIEEALRGSFLESAFKKAMVHYASDTSLKAFEDGFQKALLEEIAGRSHAQLLSPMGLLAHLYSLQGSFGKGDPWPHPGANGTVPYEVPA